jgi:hypothetical protein
MVLRRTTVFAEDSDLALIKAAAARRGVSEAELIRDAIHLAALANQVWDEPVFSGTHRRRSRGKVSAAEARDEVWADKADRYEQTKHPKR